MIRYLIILGLLLSVVVSADEPNVKITQFGLGLNTNTDIINLKPNEASILLNYDIVGSAEGFYLRKRKGSMTLYPIVSAAVNDTLNGDDPTIGIFSFRRADGLRRICGIISQAGDIAGGNPDSTGVGWFVASPGLPATPVGSGSYYYLQDQATRVLYNYVYQGTTPHWTYWNDRTYMTNGRQRPLVFHPYNEFGRDGYVRELVPLTPGEPLIVPMDVVGNLNGEYFYMIGHSSSCGESEGNNRAVNSDFEVWANDTLSSWDTLSYTTGFFDNVGSPDPVFNGDSALMLIANGNIRNPQNIGFKQTLTLVADSIYKVKAFISKTNNNAGFNMAAYAGVSRNLLNSTSYFNSTSGFIAAFFNFSPETGDNTVDIEVTMSGACTDCDTVYVDSLTVRNITTSRLAVVTKPVITKNEKVLLTHFPWQTIVDGCAFGDAGYNSLTLDIYRTQANPGKIDIKDNFYLVTSIALSDTLEMDTLTYIDNTSDADLLSLPVTNIDTTSVGRSAAVILTGVRVGAPTYVSRNGFGVAKIDATPIHNKTVVQKISYMCTYYDSLINAESDSSRSLHIFNDIPDDSAYIIGLPPLPGGKNHFKRFLYKSYTYMISIPRDSISDIKDTTIMVNHGNTRSGDISTYKAMETISRLQKNKEMIVIEPPFDWSVKKSGVIYYFIKYYETYKALTGDTLKIDTVETIYRRIAEISGSDSVFIDTISFDSTQGGSPYFQQAAPFNLNGITSLNDALFGYAGSVLYWSYVDTGSIWGSYRNIVLDADDGDEITAILPMRDYIRVYKNMSQYLVYPGDEYEYERREMVEQLGCVAPNSALSYQNSVFYLSHQGVIREQGSEFRDGGSTFGNISEPINNILLNRTMDALRKGYSFVHNKKYHIAFSDVDTTFVFHLKSGGWTIYDYAPKQVANYDTLTENNNNKVPSSDLVFIDGEGDQLYKFDTLATDTSYFDTGANPDTLLRGATIISQYRSAPFAVTSDYHKIGKFGIWRESNDDTTGLNVRLYNAEGDSVFYKYVDSIARRFDIHGVNVDKSNYFQIDVEDSLADSLAIPRIDGWVIPMGARPDE